MKLLKRILVVTLTIAILLATYSCTSTNNNNNNNNNNPTNSPEESSAPSEKTVYAVGYYTKSKGYVYLDQEYTNLEEAKAKLLEKYDGEVFTYAIVGYAVYNKSTNELVYSETSDIGTRILAEAYELKWYIRKNGFHYGDCKKNPAIDDSEKEISCDRFVNWVLYNAGFDDQSAKYGYCIKGSSEYHGASHDMEKFLTNNGFTKIKYLSELQPGDIVVLDNHGENENWSTRDGLGDHMFIYGGYTSVDSGNYWRFDCGNETRISGKENIPVNQPISNFLYGYRAPSKKA